MSSDRVDLAGEIERAWTGFRSRLADRIAGLEDDEFFVVEMEDDDKDALLGAAPYLQFKGWSEELVRAEVSSNTFLDERFQVTEEGAERIRDLGFEAPDGESGSPNFHTDLERREADRLAVVSVQVLREVFGCPHPMFLDADGLEVDPDVPLPGAPRRDAVADEPLVVFPESQEELREHVDRALLTMLGEPLRHDGDGDVPIVVGSSVVYVRVIADRPAVDVFAEIVVEVGDLARAEQEVNILNRTHGHAKFYVRDDRVLMSHRIVAWPFAPEQLRVVVDEICSSVDDIARDLAQRTGGHRFLDSFPPSRPPEVVEPDEGYSPLVGLLEVMYDGPARPPLVAALFDNDRRAIIAQLVRLRTGVDQPGHHDLEVVLRHLRAALRFVADGEALRPPRRPVPPRRRRTHQLSLLPDLEEPLDAELWGTDQLEESS